MNRFVRDLRLIPIALIASACLLTLKTADLFFHGSLFLSNGGAPSGDVAIVRPMPDATQPPGSALSWAQQMFNFPNSKGAPPERTDLAFLPAIAPLASDRNNADIITGSVTAPSAEKSEKPKGEGNAAAGKEAANKDAPAKEPKEPPPSPNGAVISMNAAPAPSAAERAILERLQERRQELEKRARELDIREGLIAEAEKRVDSKLAEIKEGQAQLAIAVQKKDEAEAARFKGLVTMYETMKPRDAAKIFDRLEVGVLLQVASQINPRNMSEILALMSPDRAEHLTVELANRAQASPKNAVAGLPKIEGRPAGQ
jgi:flagellar motility protein MotE (MotC chaperone)